MYSAISQANDRCSLNGLVVNALSESQVGTMRHKALLSFCASVREHDIVSVSEDSVRLWIADMLLRGFKRATMRSYFNSIHVICRGWCDFSKSDPFENVREDLYRDYNLNLIVISENLKRVRYILEKSSVIDNDSGTRETYDMFLYLLYDVNWKTHARMTPEAKARLTPENFLGLTPKSFGRRGQFYFGLFAFGGFDFTEAFAGEFDAMCGVDNAIEYGVSHRWVADCLIPVLNRQLRCDDDGFAPVSVLDDFHQVCAFLGVERHQEEVVEYQQLHFLEFLEFTVNEAFVLGDFQCSHQFGGVCIEDSHPGFAGFVSEGCGDVAFARTTQAGYEQVLATADKIE